MSLVARPPVQRKLKPWSRFRRWVQRLGPYQSLLLLIVPLATVEPLKIAALVIAGQGHWLSGTMTIIAAYATSLLVTDRLFRLVKPKLLMLPWFAAIWTKAVCIWDVFRSKAARPITAREE